MRNNVKRLLALLVAALLVFGLVGCQGTPTTNDDSQTPIGEGMSELTGLKKDPTILFMGDSITDGGRTDYKNKTDLTNNHPKWVADYLTKTFPDEKFTFYNTGVSGDTIYDQYFRLKEDCYDLDPDYIIMMLGVNDSWNLYGGRQNFENMYRHVLDGILSHTDAKLILMQSYLFEADAGMQSVCVIPDVNSYIPKVVEIGDVIATLAAEYNLDIIYLPEIFKQQHEKKGTPYGGLASDAIHPTSLGVQIMTDQILVKLGVKGYQTKYDYFDTSAVAESYRNKVSG